MPRKPKKEPAKMGRPKKPIDWELVANLCRIHCTQAEIAGVIGVHIDTLNNRAKQEHKVTFSEFLKKNREAGKASLRRMMWKKVESGSTAMLIWLSKNWLGMTDKQETTHKQNDGETWDVTLNLNDDVGG